MPPLFFLALALALVGCTGDEQTAALIGAWGLERGDGCTVAAVFEMDGTHESYVVCRLTTGDWGVERRSGTFETEGDRLAMRFTHGTCDEEPGTLTVRYSADETQLVMDGSDGRLVFQRLDPDGKSAGIDIHGCWDGDRLVTGDLRPL